MYGGFPHLLAYSCEAKIMQKVSNTLMCVLKRLAAILAAVLVCANFAGAISLDKILYSFPGGQRWRSRLSRKCRKTGQCARICSCEGLIGRAFGTKFNSARGIDFTAGLV
jgi:hypothetical protein